MSKVQILVYGNHPEILATVLRLINANDHWQGEGSTRRWQWLAKK